MYMTAQQFIDEYRRESAITFSLLESLNDEALATSPGAGFNSLGQLCWHIAAARCLMLNQCGFELPPHGFGIPGELTANGIRELYGEVSCKLLEQVARKSDADLQVVHRYMGAMDITLAEMLRLVVSHEIHHRGQASILLRIAGLPMPGIYGPNREATEEMMKQMADQG